MTTQVRKWRPSRKDSRQYPSIPDVAVQIRITASPANEDGEHSSPALTAWYVAAFCRANKLRHEVQP